MTISKSSAALIVGIAIVFASSTAHAEDNGFTSFWKRVFKYPVKTTENVANTTGHALSNTGGVAASAAHNTGATLSGDFDKAGQIVAEPVARTVNTSGALISETAGSPVKAAEDTANETK